MDTTSAPAAAAQARAAIIAEARKLGVDVLFSEKGHYNAAAAWRTRNYILGIPATLIGAAAGATILASAPPAISGILALTGAALTALVTFLNPSERASEHHRAGVSYGILRRSIRQFIQIDALGGKEADLRKRLSELTEEVASAQRESLPIPAYAYSKAAKTVKAGSADYIDSELNAAVGPVNAATLTGPNGPRAGG